MFGTLFYREAELADAIIDAILATPDMDEAALKEKLYEISAENFGRKVYEYYLDLKISNDFSKEYLHEESFVAKVSQLPLVITRTASNLPKRILVSTTQQTRKMAKLSLTKIKSIRDNMD